MAPDFCSQGHPNQIKARLKFRPFRRAAYMDKILKARDADRLTGRAGDAVFDRSQSRDRHGVPPDRAVIAVASRRR
jgi:hypothetical protein